MLTLIDIDQIEKREEENEDGNEESAQVKEADNHPDRAVFRLFFSEMPVKPYYCPEPFHTFLDRP